MVSVLWTGEIINILEVERSNPGARSPDRSAGTN
jgi:hypothetical protein